MKSGVSVTTMDCKVFCVLYTKTFFCTYAPQIFKTWGGDGWIWVILGWRSFMLPWEFYLEFWCFRLKTFAFIKCHLKAIFIKMLFRYQNWAFDYRGRYLLKENFESHFFLLVELWILVAAFWNFWRQPWMFITLDFKWKSRRLEV